MSFPETKYEAAGEYCLDYLARLGKAAQTIDPAAVSAAGRMLQSVLDRDGIIYSCGNGGSAAISDHLVCDCAKGARTDVAWKPRVVSLSATGSLVTAIANDIAYGEVFAYQVETFGRPGDQLITISSSGNSPNVVRAIEVARDIGMTSISLTGFTGGASARLADVNIHVDADNYGIVEDIHQSIMHILAQYLRQSRMPLELIQARTF